MPEPPAVQFENPCLGRIVFGQRPAGLLHLGHLLGSIAPVIALQPQYEMVILAADGLPGSNDTVPLDGIHELAACWLAAGLSPNETLLARLSTLNEIEALACLLTPYAVQGMTVPTDLYMEACTLIALQATHVPAHPAQREALDLAAIIVRTLNAQTGAHLPEPAWLPLRADHLPGLDGHTMRTQAGNAILLGESEESTADHLLDLPDNPASRDVTGQILRWLPSKTATATAAGTDFRSAAAAQINAHLHSLRVKRMKWLASPQELEGVLRLGSQRARLAASETLAAVQKAVG